MHTSSFLRWTSSGAMALWAMSFQPLSAETIVGLGRQNTLLTFDSATPGVTGTSLGVSGLASGDVLVGIDYRPATGQLYGLGRSSSLYTIDLATAAASLVGAGAFNPNISGDAFGFDFNPTVDRIRLVSDNGQNLRLHPGTGAVAATDSPLNYAMGDINAGQAPQIVGAAYTDNVAGATTTTLYVLDSVMDTLVRQIPPNAGVLNTVGSLGVNITDTTGFDISGASGRAYASFVEAGESWSGLYSIELTSGAATYLGDIGNREWIMDIAVVPEPGLFGWMVGGAVGLWALRRRTPSFRDGPR